MEVFPHILITADGIWVWRMICRQQHRLRDPINMIFKANRSARRSINEAKLAVASI